ncbi:uncharacterized protein LOC129798843 isoform X2 [Phlebotomus papatasi]|uniref:uncharacterized protein LOC129798843 isoform X2 n=1 Tax=Phlebotomus papatasi TaxID=29031 RepID=UPI0024838EAE|nr:uncharacterized protein LOC129798843 isoform X2 [Phlebotomus papatasi]
MAAKCCGNFKSRHRKGVGSTGVASRSVTIHRSRGSHCHMVDELHMRPSRRNNSKPPLAVAHTSMLGPKGGACGGRWNRCVAKVTLCGILCLMATMETCLAARQEAVSNCTFPQRWEGSWFQSGLQPIYIKGSILSFRGKCVASDGDKFLMVDDKGCHRCVVIYEKHKNVLQYKESECEDLYMDQPIQEPRSVLKSDRRGGAHPNTNGHSRLSSSDHYLLRSHDDIDNCYCRGRETLQNLCEQIPGDALLFSMFKENAEPVKCPLKGPFTFTYNRGHGECKSPVSNIESCTEDSRLLLSFQACPDVAGTESTVEELTCLATWKDGNSRYLVGLVSHHHATSNEERYRCFVYEKTPTGMGLSSKDAAYKLAQSGDATCNGLDSAEVGSRIMTLRKAPPAERCDFPAWFKGPKHWHALQGNVGYTFHQSDGSMHITRQSGAMETRALCEQINKQTPTEMMAVVHYTTGCQSGFMCMMFYRRDTHVAEIQMGSAASRVEDACAPDHFDINKLPYITLLAINPESEICPLEGLYPIRGAIGPPYVASRHKRNHSNNNNKGHIHGGHHHEINSHRRHGSLSFRNSEEINDGGSWHRQTRGIATRERRSVQPVSDTAIGPGRSRRDIPTCVTNYNSVRRLLIGCRQTNIIEVHPTCSEDGDEMYSCHGNWTDNSTVFIVARHVGTSHGVCITYRPADGNTAQLYVGESCYRSGIIPAIGTSLDHHLVANLTVHDKSSLMDLEAKCSDTNSSSLPTNHWILIWTIATVSILAVYSRR